MYNEFKWHKIYFCRFFGLTNNYFTFKISHQLILLLNFQFLILFLFFKKYIELFCYFNHIKRNVKRYSISYLFYHQTPVK